MSWESTSIHYVLSLVLRGLQSHSEQIKFFCLGFSTISCLNFVVRYSTPGGYSARAVHPIALGKVMSIAKMMKSEFDSENYTLSAIGGVETGGDAAEFILLGANTVQV